MRFSTTPDGSSLTLDELGKARDKLQERAHGSAWVADELRVRSWPPMTSPWGGRYTGRPAHNAALLGREEEVTLSRVLAVVELAR